MLYSYPQAPNPRRLHVFLAEKGLSIPTETVDLMKGEQHGEAFRRINPLRTVPLLVTDEGESLAQVVAICDYLEALHPEPPLLGTSPLEKALIREWCHRVFLEGFLPIAEVFRNSNPAFANRGLPGPIECPQIPALIERGERCVDAFWQMLDARLAGREFVAGDRFTMADIDAAVACGFARWIRRSIPEGCANLQRWHDRVQSRPSLQAARG